MTTVDNTHVYKNSSVPFGFSNRLLYDNCEYQKKLSESTTPLYYQLYGGKFVNDQNCMNRTKHFWKPYDLVDYESELWNITRHNSRCPQFKYNPLCVRNESCISTHDRTVPIVIPASLCPIVTNNIQKTTDTGIYTPLTSMINTNEIHQASNHH